MDAHTVFQIEADVLIACDRWRCGECDRSFSYPRNDPPKFCPQCGTEFDAVTEL